MSEPLRLNWGCGPVKRPGWIGLDMNPDHEPDEVSDTVRDGLAFATGSVSMIVANHSLQMVGWHDAGRVLGEFNRVLVPGGVLRILTPDVVGAFRAWDAGDLGWFPVADNVTPDPDSKLAAYLTWYSEARTLWLPGALREFLARAGFESPFPMCGAWQTLLAGDARITELDSRPHESLIIEARK